MTVATIGKFRSTTFATLWTTGLAGHEIHDDNA